MDFFRITAKSPTSQRSRGFLTSSTDPKVPYLTVIWDEQYRQIDIAASETEPLLGMAIFYGYRLQVDNVEGGIVKIEAL
jgi:hypothetical protein